MKGDLETPFFLLSNVFFILTVVLITVTFVSTNNEVTSEVLIPALQKRGLADATHVMETCISADKFITAGSIEAKAVSCMEKLKLTYVKITDIETGKEWVYGDRIKGIHSYRMFTKIRSGDEVGGGIIYAEA